MGFGGFLCAGASLWTISASSNLILGLWLPEVSSLRTGYSEIHNFPAGFPDGTDNMCSVFWMQDVVLYLESYYFRQL